MRWRAVAALLVALATAPAGAGAEELYAIDQRFGEIGFSVGHLGLFRSRGSFASWAGSLAIDEAHPEHTRIDVTIATGSVAMEWEQARAMLRGPAYFDVVRYPEAHFVSTAVEPQGPDDYAITGTLTLRGVARPVRLEAHLLGRAHDTAEFVVTGELRRSAFGMTADRSFVSDRVQLEIHARVRLDAAARGG